MPFIWLGTFLAYLVIIMAAYSALQQSGKNVDLGLMIKGAVHGYVLATLIVAGIFLLIHFSADVWLHGPAWHYNLLASAGLAVCLGVLIYMPYRQIRQLL